MKTNKTIVFATLALTLFASCSEEFLSPEGIDFSMNESGVVSSSSEVSSDQFHDKIVGHGWKCVSRREILEDGSLSKTDWTEIYYDGGGTSYLFDDSTFTSYFWVDAIPADCFSIHNYIYENSLVYTGGDPGDFGNLRLLKLSGDRFSCIVRLSMRYSSETGTWSKPVYGYCTYKRMTDNELNEYRKQYTFDYDEWLNSQY